MRNALDRWRATFGDIAPAGFVCRNAHPERWLRVHSLPESKRYPETNTERREILERHAAVARHVLGDGTQCTLFISRWGPARVWAADDLPWLGVLPAHLASFLSPEDDGFVNEPDWEWLQVFGIDITWKAHGHDRLVLACANDATGPLLVANLFRGTAYAPYDGGADLFFPDSMAVDVARDAFGDWVPAGGL